MRLCVWGGDVESNNSRRLNAGPGGRKQGDREKRRRLVGTAVDGDIPRIARKQRALLI